MSEATKGDGLCLQTAVLLPAQPTAQENGRATATMVYGDGTAVDTGNQTEVQTYNAYLAEKQSPP